MTPTGPLLSRRQILAGLGAGGVLIAVGGLAACTRDEAPSGGSRAGSSGSPPEFMQPEELISSNGRLEVTLVAAAATVPYSADSRWALTYNGTTPGPTLRVRPGDVLTVTLDNRLDTPTNLHTHGLHVSPEGDSDNVFVMVDAGQQHTYRYEIPADHPSGTFWYHPHHHGTVAPQVFAGLAGTIIVEDAVDELAQLTGSTSRVLVLADPNIGDNAAVVNVSMMDRMLGREGNAIIVNGLPQPRIRTRAGTLEHWRIVNTSPSRYFALRLDGLPLHLIATDGGRLDAPHPVDEIVLVPGERAEVLIPVSTAGSHVLTTRSVDRGGMGTGGMQGGMGRDNAAGQAQDATTIVAFLDVEGPSAPAPALPSVLRDQEEPPDEVTRTRDVTLSMNMGMGGTGGDGQFLIDGHSFDENRVDVTTRLGTTEDWVIHNTSPMDHPFHLHVWPFRVIERSDDKAVSPGWKDTVNVPAGKSVRVRIPFRDFTGKAVYHCHILDHEDLGMMGVIDTRPQ